MARYNIFNQVHKGLRALLYETMIQLQQTDFTNADETEDVIERIKIILSLFDSHAHTEDQFILPAIVQYEPSVVDAFEQEHVKDLQLSQQLSDQLKALSLSVSTETKIQMGAVLSTAVLDFMLFNLSHMKKEEDVLNKLLWRYYSDDELKGITHSIVARVAPEKMSLYSKWMMRGLNNAEISNWLKEVKNNAPDFVFESLMRVASAELSEHRWQLVQEDLTEGAMLA